MFTSFIIRLCILPGFAVILAVATRTYHSNNVRIFSVLADVNGSLSQIGDLRNDPFTFDCYHPDGRLTLSNISFETKRKHSSQRASTMYNKEFDVMAALRIYTDRHIIVRLQFRLPEFYSAFFYNFNFSNSI